MRARSVVTAPPPATPAPKDFAALPAIDKPDPGPWGVVKGIAAIITPLTLITALMYYFGLIHAYWFFLGFSVDYTVFELSPEDYILRSADGLMFPFCVAALGVLGLTWLFQLLMPRFSTETTRRSLQVVVPVFSVLGAGLTVLAGVAFVRPLLFVERPSVGGLALVSGVLLLSGAIAAMRRLSRARPGARPRPSASWRVAEWVAVVMLVSVGLFWAVGDWSARVGAQRAKDVAATLPSWPAAVLYSERSLNLDIAGVTETVCQSDAEQSVFRYDGLVLITQEGGQLLMLPRSWTEQGGTAVVLAKNDSLRLEFSAFIPQVPETC